MGDSSDAKSDGLFIVESIYPASGGGPAHHSFFFEHRANRVEVLDLKQRVEAQAKTMSHMENNCKEFQSRIN